MGIDVTLPADLSVTVGNEANQAIEAVVPNTLPYHTHPIADIEGLQTSLGSLQTQINNKAAAVHTHAISDVLLLQNSLESLQTQIYGKAATSHTHTFASLTDFAITTPADKQPLVYNTATGKFINSNVIILANNLDTGLTLTGTGSYSSPSIRFGTNTGASSVGLLLDGGRLAFIAQNTSFVLGSQGIVGSFGQIKLGNTGGVNSAPIFSAYRLNTPGTSAGLGGGVLGDANLISNNTIGLQVVWENSQMNIKCPALGTFCPPLVTQTQRDALTVGSGYALVVNTTTKTIDFYNGTSWIAL